MHGRVYVLIFGTGIGSLSQFGIDAVVAVAVVAKKWFIKQKIYQCLNPLSQFCNNQSSKYTTNVPLMWTVAVSMESWFCIKYLKY